MNKKAKKIVSGLGLAALSGSFAGPVSVLAEDAVSAPTSEQTGFEIAQGQKREYAKVANVEGEFRFDQNVLSPGDSVFSLFGTAATAACAAPSFVFEDKADAFVDYYLNVGGRLKQTFKVSMQELSEKGTQDILKCSCAMSPSIVNVEVTGVPLANIVQMADLEEDINTVVVKGSDGYAVSVSLQKALEKNALLVYKVGGTGLKPENGGPVQLWMPGAAASYFTRQVTDIEFTHSDAEPAQPDTGRQQAKVSVLNTFENAVFKTGSAITFEGYADDFETPITAVEFSLDGGETWSAFDTPNASPSKWVYWYFTYTPKQAGLYRLDVRSRTAEGISPMASGIEFTVE